MTFLHGIYLSVNIDLFFCLSVRERSVQDAGNMETRDLYQPIFNITFKRAIIIMICSALRTSHDGRCCAGRDANHLSKQ